MLSGMIVVKDNQQRGDSKVQTPKAWSAGLGMRNVLCVESESELFDALVQLVHRWDADILVGYEIQPGGVVAAGSLANL
jgi:DNA polymerase elongation subunit (family B)